MRLVAVDAQGYESGDAIELPGGLVWIDWDWCAEASHVDLSLTGEPLVQSATRGGRPITLAGWREGNKAYGVATVAFAQELLETVGGTFALTLDGEATARRVIWRTDGVKPVELDRFWGDAPAGVLTVRFMEV
ncbi:hypothetical protein [Endothiovibrio diazotrophicus]